MPEPSLELLQQMVQRVLDAHRVLRDDNQQFRRRLGWRTMQPCRIKSTP